MISYSLRLNSLLFKIQVKTATVNPMLKELLDKQRNCTDHFFTSIDLQPIEQLVQLLLNCKGSIVFTGVGKSGLVAKKISFTMVSTGTRSYYLSPTDAMHGDLGMVSPNDIFLILSKSGESEELINLIPAIQNKGATTIAVVCHPFSRLAKACHMKVILPFKQELCPYDLAPTMSTTAQLLFGDLLTIALMRQKNISLDHYALNHPSGRIGKRTSLKVKDLMLTDERIPLCKPDDYLEDILVELSKKRCGCILVADENLKLLGLFTDGDLRRTLEKFKGNALKLRMHEIMNSCPSSISPEALAWNAMQEMEADPKRRIMMLPVLDEEKNILGLIHLHDILQSGL